MATDTTLTGNLTRDPEVKYGQAGAMARATVAVSRRWQRDGDWQEQTSFIDIIAYGALAENFAASTGKGTRVIVTGRLEQSSWQADDGTKKSLVRVVASDIGTSLQYARAEVERIERTDAPRPAPRAAQQAAPDDEEPF